MHLFLLGRLSGCPRVSCSGRIGLVSSIRVAGAAARVDGRCGLRRFYSTREQRRTQRGTQKVEQESQMSPLWDREVSRRGFEHSDMIPGDGTTESLLTGSVLGYLRKVYATIGITTAFCVAGSIGGLLLGPAATGLAGLCALASIGTVLGVYFVPQEKVFLRQNLLWGTGVLLGLSMAPLVSVSALSTLIMAATGTTAIFAGFSLAALKAKSTTFLQLGGIMFAALLGLLGISLVTLVGPFFGMSAAFAATLHSVNLYFGLGLFSLYIAYDTQRMIANASMGNTDHVTDALSMFLNIYQVFVRLLSIFNSD